MLRLTPILLAIAYAIIAYRFSAWRTHRELDARSTELADPELKRLTDRLAASLEVARVPVFVYEIDPVNGLAAPDGRIFITRGFYRKYRSGEVSGEELASVIAHELGHVALGHSRRRMIDFSGQNAIRTVLMMVLGRFVPVIGPWLAGMVCRRAALQGRDRHRAAEVPVPQARRADAEPRGRDTGLAGQPPEDRGTHRRAGTARSALGGLSPPRGLHVARFRHSLRAVGKTRAERTVP